MTAILTVIPSIHRETTYSCLKSIKKKNRRNVYVIDNEARIQNFQNFNNSDTKIFYPLQNIGVARSWNSAIKYARVCGYEWLVILSASIQFNDGMEHWLGDIAEHESAMGLVTQEGWHCIAFNMKIFDKIGIFDTNYYPGYFEDSDFINRMELAGIHQPCGAVQLPGVPVDAQSTTIAHAMKLANIKINMQACANYHVGKWGILPVYTSQAERDKMYRHPFGNPENGLDYFVERSIPELKLAYNL